MAQILMMSSTCSTVSGSNSGVCVPSSKVPGSLATCFLGGGPLLRPLVSSRSSQKTMYVAKPVSIRCEQSSKKSNGLDIWLGRLAMGGFASAITVEVITGKGLLENFGFTEPLPPVALAITGVVGVLTAFFVLQSGSSD
ncbi:Stress enhanced protein 1 [Zostera marina]|uniref:Stress enhanced protein 1 n=1 Tax=Zostera marina TaxID=29655 RepID=A0A0K9Q581_ZOSMR|nr:Stress enhanced protein 1 [Zostera marina]